MKYYETTIPEVFYMEPKVFGDDRGFFMETYRQDDFFKKTDVKLFVQDNHSKSKQGILRGLHYQTEKTQGKLVRVVQGRVYDVAVDMREESPTFGKWVGVELSAINKRQFWVPKGFAHGFYVLSETAEFVYKCTDYYHPESEVTLRWDDKSVGIDWPLIGGKKPELSQKDSVGLSLSDCPKL